MEEIRLHQFAENLDLRGYSKRVVKDYPANVRLFFRYMREVESVAKLSDITPAHLTAYHAHLQYGRARKGEAYATGTVCARLLSVRTFFRLMAEERYLPMDISTGMAMPRRNTTLPRQVPDETDMKTLLDAITPDGPVAVRDRAMLELMYATGLRNEEVRTLTLGSLDIADRTLLVHGKGGRDRLLPVGGWVMPYLLEYLEAARPKLISLREPTELLFVSKNGRMITNANLTTLVRKYAEGAGVGKRVTPHTFRHACATHLLKGGMDIRYVQELLGHADLSTTQLYTRLTLQDLKSVHARCHPRERLAHEP